MIKQCLVKAIQQTEFSGRAINKKVAEDVSHRIKLITGHSIAPETLYKIFRERLSESDISISDKNAIAQFAKYYSWEDFIQKLESSTDSQKKFPTKIFFFAFIFMASIYIMTFLIKHLVL